MAPKIDLPSEIDMPRIGIYTDNGAGVEKDTRADILTGQIINGASSRRSIKLPSGKQIFYKMTSSTSRKLSAVAGSKELLDTLVKEAFEAHLTAPATEALEAKPTGETVTKPDDKTPVGGKVGNTGDDPKNNKTDDKPDDKTKK